MASSPLMLNSIYKKALRIRLPVSSGFDGIMKEGAKEF